MRRRCTLCTRAHNARGYCRTHYYHWKRYGVADRRGEARSICAVEGCTSQHDARGYCRTHYAYWRRTGQTPTLRSRPTGCTIDGCTQPHKAHGYCNTHYRRWKAIRTHQAQARKEQRHGEQVPQQENRV